MKRPRAYIWLQSALGADRLRHIALHQFVHLKQGARVLDLGCGPGHVLSLMPEVDYVGFDTQPEYIEYARMRYGSRGRFVCEQFGPDHVSKLEPFDAILLFGLLHHLDDESAAKALLLSVECLKPAGRIVTIDPCLTDDQSAVARWVAMNDRGRFVRRREGYMALVNPLFDDIEEAIFHNVCRIPSTELIMSLGRAAAGQRP